MKKSILKILLALTATILLSGFTFDERVLEICGNKHANDFVGRLVCNNNMHEEMQLANKKERQAAENIKRREAASVCIATESALIDQKITELKFLLDKYGGSDLKEIEEVLRNIKNIKSPTLKVDNIIRKNQEDIPEAERERVLVFKIDSQCDDKIYHLVNINSNQYGQIRSMRVWEKWAGDTSQSYAIEKHNWVRQGREGIIVSRTLERIAMEEAYKKQLKKEASIEEEKLKKLNLCLAQGEKHFVDQIEAFRKITINADEVDGEMVAASIKEYFNKDKFNLKTIKRNIDFGRDQSQIAITYACNEISSIKNNYVLEVKNNMLRSGILTRGSDGQILFDWKSKSEITEINNNKFYGAVKNVLSLLIILAVIGISLYLTVFKKYQPQPSGEKIGSPLEKLNPLTQDLKQPQVKTLNSTEDKFLQSSYEPLTKNQKDMQNLFRSKHPFVKHNIPYEKMTVFIQNCEEYKEKTGDFPTLEEQLSILKRI